MKKKELKMYEAPVVEVVEMEAQSVICASDPTSDWDPNWPADEG